MAATVSWNPNRYGSTKQVLKFDATTGTYSMVDEAHDYTGITYNFAALPVAGATTTTAGTTTGTTTAAQTADAFGNVAPLFSPESNGGGGNGSLPLVSEKDTSDYAKSVGEAGVILPKKKPEGLVAKLTEERAEMNREFETWSNSDDLQMRFPTFQHYQRALHPIDIGISYGLKKTKDTLLNQWEKIKTSPFGVDLGKRLTKTKEFIGEKFVTPGMAAIKAISETYRPGANRNYAGVAGLYEKEIGLMVQYGSTAATQGNPTGDRRKDDAGFNIVSGAGNYNTIGSYSRRSNMIKEYKKEGKTANDARADWKKEKETNQTIATNIDSSGSTPKAPTEPVSVTVPSHISGNGQQESRDQRGDAGKAGGEQHEAIGSF
jgi:hypothetical protein